MATLSAYITTQVDMSVLLLARDPQLLDRQDTSGQTALHYAASCGHRDMVQLLVSRWIWKMYCLSSHLM